MKIKSVPRGSKVKRSSKSFKVPKLIVFPLKPVLSKLSLIGYTITKFVQNCPRTCFFNEDVQLIVSDTGDKNAGQNFLTFIFVINVSFLLTKRRILRQNRGCYFDIPEECKNGGSVNHTPDWLFEQCTNEKLKNPMSFPSKTQTNLAKFTSASFSTIPAMTFLLVS